LYPSAAAQAPACILLTPQRATTPARQFRRPVDLPSTTTAPSPIQHALTSSSMSG
jgi:hypothetical protein